VNLLLPALLVVGGLLFVAIYADFILTINTLPTDPLFYSG